MAYIPTDPHLYQGKQVIINSDRLVFNAKDDSILLYSDKAIGFNTKGNVHFDLGVNLDEVKEGDTQNKFVVNSPNIYLGLQKSGNLQNEPALLGNETQTWLNDLLVLVDDILDDILYKVAFVSTAPGSPTAPNPANFSNLQMRKDEIQRLSQALEEIKSKNTKLV